MTSVLILDGDTRGALAAIRALGEKKISAYVGASSDSSLAGCSRFCTQRLVYPDPYARADEFIEWLKDVCRRLEISVVLPASDLTALLLVEAQPLPNSLHGLIPSIEKFELATDKWRLMRLAEEQGIQSPKSILVRDKSQLAQLPSELGLPFVLKPRSSYIKIGDQYRKREVRVIRSENDLRSLGEEMIAEGDLIAQEFVDGVGVGFFALFQNGECVLRFAHRRVREKPPSGGVSVVSTSIAMDEHTAGKSIELLQALQWCGVAMVEFRSGSTGTYLMEINARFWGSLQLAILSGANFPTAMVGLSRGENISEDANYVIGKRNRWLLGDLDNLLLQLLRSSPKLNFGQKTQVIRSFLNIGGAKQNFEVLRLADPMPFLFEITRYVADIFRSRKKRNDR